MRSRASLTRLVALAAAGLGVVALGGTASASTFGYVQESSETVLTIDVADGPQGHGAISVETVPNSPGTYTFTTTDGTTSWDSWTQSGTSLNPYASAITNAGAALTIDAGVGGVPVDRVRITGINGWVTAKGGTQAWVDPLEVTLTGTSSRAATVRTWHNDLTFDDVSFAAGKGIALSAGRVSLGYGLLTAARVDATGTTSLGGNITTTGPVIVTGDVKVTEGSTHRVQSDPTTGFISISGAIVDAPAAGRPTQAGLSSHVTLAAPEITLNRGVTMTGGLTAEQAPWGGNDITRLNGPVDMAGGYLDVDGRLQVSGAAHQTIRTGHLSTQGDITTTPLCGGEAIASCDVDVQSEIIRTTDLTLDVGEWSNGGDAYVPGNLTVTGAAMPAPLWSGGPAYVTSSIQAGGVLDLRGGVHVPVTGSMTVQGSPTILAGATEPVAAGAIDAADVCDPGPLMSIGDLQVTAPIECLSDLKTGPGTTLLAADVTTVGHQAYSGPVTVALNGAPRRLRAGGQAGVRFNAGVGATWGAQPGDVQGYSVTGTPGGAGCSAGPEARSCVFTTPPEGNDVTFDLATSLRSASVPEAPKKPATDAAKPLPSGRTTRRSVARASRTPLTTLIVPPKSRGKRTWREQGPCRIAAGRLVAPNYTGTCTVTLRVAKHRRTKAWNGRAVVDVG